MNKKQELATLIKAGVQLLKDELAYSQTIIIQKIKQLPLEISAPSLSNTLHDKPVGTDALQKLSIGIQELIKKELGFIYDASQLLFVPSTPVERPPMTNPPSLKELPPRFYSTGRLPIHEKINFMQPAQENIIEVGVRLKTFSEYFTSRSKYEFQWHIEKLLQRGVDLQVYLLDPASATAQLYFQDRAQVQKAEQHAIDDTQRALQRLADVKNNFTKNNYPGQLEIFTYLHIPYNHFLVVDGHTPSGKMAISHYMYGIERADCPVMEFAHHTSPSLYERYWNSLQLFIKNAQKVL